MIVKVTAEHIRLGKARDCFNCPIAMAIWDALGKRSMVAVFGPGDNGVARAKVDGACYDLPPLAESFIMNFDFPGLTREARVWRPEPFEFELPIEGARR